MRGIIPLFAARLCFRAFIAQNRTRHQRGVLLPFIRPRRQPQKSIFQAFQFHRRALRRQEADLFWL